MFPGVLQPSQDKGAAPSKSSNNGSASQATQRQPASSGSLGPSTIAAPVPNTMRGGHYSDVYSDSDPNRNSDSDTPSLTATELGELRYQALPRDDSDDEDRGRDAPVAVSVPAEPQPSAKTTNKSEPWTAALSRPGASSSSTSEPNTLKVSSVLPFPQFGPALHWNLGVTLIPATA